MPQGSGLSAGAVGVTTRVCSRCGERQPIDAFRYMATVDRYRADCRECESIASSASRRLRNARREAVRRDARDARRHETVHFGTRRPFGYDATSNATSRVGRADLNVGHYNASDPLDRVFGVEMELTGPDFETIRDALVEQGLNVLNERRGYGATNGNAWELKRDGSVHGHGLELASPKLRGYEGFEELKKACRALQSVGATVDASCGLHVHVDFRNMNLAAIRNEVRVLLANQDHVMSAMAPSRRTNSYCSAWSARDIETLNAMDGAAGLSGYSVPGPRGLVNLHAYGAHGSVEFRSHGGTTSYKKVAAWVRFLLRALDYGARHNYDAMYLRFDTLRAMTRAMGTDAVDTEVLRRFELAAERVEEDDQREATDAMAVAS